MNVAVLDIQCGNIGSVLKALENAGATAKTVNTTVDISEATHLIIPGVGHFDRAMKHLENAGLISAIQQRVANNKPTLGICLGMQIMAVKSDEGELAGLQLFDAEIRELRPQDTQRYKVPHNGWNTLEAQNHCLLLDGISANDEFFFLHKYVWQSHADAEVFATTTYAIDFPVIIGKGNCWGVQFHPEKSHDAGLRLLHNFMRL